MHSDISSRKKCPVGRETCQKAESRTWRGKSGQVEFLMANGKTLPSPLPNPTLNLGEPTRACGDCDGDKRRRAG